MNNAISVFSAAPASGTPIQKLRAQAEELEGVFLTTLTKAMFSGLDAKSGFGGGFAEETWRSMQSEQFAASMAQAGGIGLADQLVSELIALQSASSANGATR